LAPVLHCSPFNPITSRGTGMAMAPAAETVPPQRGLRSRAASQGLRVHPTAMGRGRAHPRGASQPRGAAPRQQRRGAGRRPYGQSTFGAHLRQSSVGVVWNDDTRTSGLFDSALRLTWVDERRRNALPTTFGATGNGSVMGAGSVASLSSRSTPRSTSARSMNFHRAAGSRHHLQDINGLTDQIRTGTVTAAEHSGTPSMGAFDTERTLGEGTSSAASSVGMHSLEPLTMSCPTPADTTPLAPPQLEVLHVQRREASKDADDIPIVMLDGTRLGTCGPTQDADSQAHVASTVLLMPRIDRIPTPGCLEPALPLKAPAAPVDRLQSLSERLSVLLGGPSPAPSSRPHHPPDMGHPQAKGSAILRGNYGAVLRHVDTLADAVLQRILADTTEELDRLTKQTVVSPPPLPTPTPPGNDCLETWAAREAACELEALEARLAQKYTDAQVGLGPLPHNSGCPPPAQALGGPATVAVLPHPLSMTIQLGSVPGNGTSPVDGARWWIPPRPTRDKGRKSCIATEICAPVHERRELRPAALPLARVRQIEQYRLRFARHCIAAREAGLDSGGLSDTSAIATWIIWPQLADDIATAIVESVVEEVHAAMERHVEEMVLREVGAR